MAINKDISRLNLKKYKLVIFDWDGTLINSTDAYPKWDQLFVKDFYGVDWPLDKFYELSQKLKQVKADKSEDSAYFRHLDRLFGDGETPMDIIWQNIYKHALKIQGQIDYKKNAHLVLRSLRDNPKLKLALSTNSELKDIKFYSSKKSKTARKVSPLDFFDKVLTIDDVKFPKPHPESFQKVIDFFSIDPSEVLVFEDSLSGVIAARKANLDVISVYDKNSNEDRHKINEISNFSIQNWDEILKIIIKEQL